MQEINDITRIRYSCPTSIHGCSHLPVCIKMCFCTTCCVVRFLCSSTNQVLCKDVGWIFNRLFFIMKSSLKYKRKRMYKKETKKKDTDGNFLTGWNLNERDRLESDYMTIFRYYILIYSRSIFFPDNEGRILKKISRNAIFFYLYFWNQTSSS